MLCSSHQLRRPRCRCLKHSERACSSPTAPARVYCKPSPVLAGGPLPPELREQVIEDTLAGAPETKRAWTVRGMIEDVSAGFLR